MTRTEFLDRLNQNIRIDTARDRAELDRAVAEHTRNGRGFWPVVTIDGVRSVIRFAAAVVTGGPTGSTGTGAPMSRWTPDTGSIDIIPIHALSPADWPHVRLAG
jgi:hypothetical protein